MCREVRGRPGGVAAAGNRAGDTGDVAGAAAPGGDVGVGGGGGVRFDD